MKKNSKTAPQFTRNEVHFFKKMAPAPSLAPSLLKYTFTEWFFTPREGGTIHIFDMAVMVCLAGLLVLFSTIFQ